MRLRPRNRPVIAKTKHPLVCSRRPRPRTRPTGGETRNTCTVLHSGRTGRVRTRPPSQPASLERGGGLSWTFRLPRFLPRHWIRLAGRETLAIRDSRPQVYRHQISSGDRSRSAKKALSPGGGRNDGTPTRAPFYRSTLGRHRKHRSQRLAAHCDHSIRHRAFWSLVV